MGVQSWNTTFQGIDGSEELLNDEMHSYNNTQVRFITDARQAKWAAAVYGDYKLVLSNGPPTLFDLKEDPDELHNSHGN